MQIKCNRLECTNTADKFISLLFHVHFISASFEFRSLVECEDLLISICGFIKYYSISRFEGIGNLDFRLKFRNMFRVDLEKM